MTACFLVRCSSDLGKESGKTWAPGKCKFFMWLVAHNRCWTADCLAQDLKEAFLIMSIASCVTRKRKPLITCRWLAFLHKFGTACYIWLVCNLSVHNLMKHLLWSGGQILWSLWTGQGLNSIVILGA